MDETYDAIVLGTGLKECLLSALLSVDGKKVLHIDRNDYYGAEGASLNLSELYKKLGQGKEMPTDIGSQRDYAVDLVPKLLMTNGDLTNILVHTEVTRYIEFKQIAGSYVFRDGRVSKVPSNEIEALKSSLMGLFEKRRLKKFLEWIQNWKDDDPATHQGIDLEKTTMKEVYAKFGLETGTQDFVGHAMALYHDDAYLTQPVKTTFDRIILYTSSVARYGKSPYIYPLYGLGELPQGFARLSAIYGGTYMLNTSVDEIVCDPETGKFVGVTSSKVCGTSGPPQTAKASMVIGDPSYFTNLKTKSGEQKVFEEGKVVRAICILKHPIPSTDDSDSLQLIIPQNQVGRKHDIYIAMVSSTHNVCPKDVYIAIVSTIVETDNAENELEPGLKLLGPIYDKFVSVSPLRYPSDSGTHDNIFITESFDATSHFESLTEDVRNVYMRATGAPLVLKKREEGIQGVA